MLIICNGTFKSGSSWIYEIISKLLQYNEIKIENLGSVYTNNINSPTSIIESKLDSFLKNESYKKKNYLTKSHFFSNNTLSKKYDNSIKFIFISREIKDAIISHYFHFCLQYKIVLNFNFYYKLIGRFKAYEIYLYNHRCKKYFSKKYHFSYNDFLINFEEAVIRLSLTLNLSPPSKSQLVEIKKETSINEMRKKIKKGKLKYTPFFSSKNSKDSWMLFRKGVKGEWKRFLSSKQKTELERIEKGKIDTYIKIIYFILFTFRRKIGKVE